MSNNTNAIVNFESAKLPSFLRAPEGSVTNALAALAAGTFPFMSIKGKRFAVVRNKEETIIMRPDDEETPANAIEVVIVSSATKYSKVFYASGYTDGSKEKPTCFSNDGVAPDPQSVEKQAKKCMTCPHNEWGSGTNGKGKACSDSLRMAISKPDELNDPMLLRVPPASLKGITEYAAMLSRKGAPMEGVVTKIKFDPTEATPKLQFSPVRWQSEAAYKEALEIAKTPIVEQILGVKPTAGAAPAAPALDEDDTPPAKPTKAAPKAKPKVEDNGDDTPPPKPAKTAKAEDDAPAKPAKPAKTTTSSFAAKLLKSLDSDDDNDDNDD